MVFENLSKKGLSGLRLCGTRDLASSVTYEIAFPGPPNDNPLYYFQAPFSNSSHVSPKIRKDAEKEIEEIFWDVT
jgi:hypothetical protein